MGTRVKIFLSVLLTLISTSTCLLAQDSLNQNLYINKTFGVGKYYWVIYDNVCPYCQQSSKYIKELDWEGNFKFLSYRDPITYILFPFLTKEECEKDVHMVTPEGKVLVGYEVFKAVIENLTATKYFNPILQNDYAKKKLTEIYEKMVEKRSCYYEKTEACGAIKQSPESPASNK